MNKELNLCEILKGHEGETFYSRCFGPLKLIKINKEGNTIELKFEVYTGDTYIFWSDGKYSTAGEIDLFPSKGQRDWNKWIKSKILKFLKLGGELVEANKVNLCFAAIERCWENKLTERTKTSSPIEKSALALLKIHQLIEVGYGGNITNDEWLNTSVYKFRLVWSVKGGCFIVDTCRWNIHSFAFHTKEQAEEFLSKPENVQLLKDYFQIN